MKALGAFLRLLANLFDPVDLSLNIPAPSDPITSIVTAGLNAFGGTVKLTDDALNIINSPQEVAARHNCSIQEAQDAIARNNAAALKSGDVTKVNEDLS